MRKFEKQPTSKMQEFSRKDHSLIFVDTTPSELIHTLSDKITILSLINYDNIEIDEIKLRQFKDTRTTERKLKAQEYIIECFEKNKIAAYGVINWNSQKIALTNAIRFLVSENYIQLHNQLTDRIDIN